MEAAPNFLRELQGVYRLYSDLWARFTAPHCSDCIARWIRNHQPTGRVISLDTTSQTHFVIISFSRKARIIIKQMSGFGSERELSVEGATYPWIAYRGIYTRGIVLVYNGLASLVMYQKRL